MTWLLLDYGEVLSLAPSAADRAAVEAAAGVRGAALWSAYWEQRPAYDRGLDATGYWTRVLGRQPGEAVVRELVARDVTMWTRPNRASLRAVERAGRQGLRLALLSNAPHDLADACDRLPWLGGLSPRLFSCRLAAIKPEPAIFEAALAALGAAADDVIFLDDRPQNVAGARAAGMRGAVLSRPGRVDDALRTAR